jgi:hypothetical protein
MDGRVIGEYTPNRVDKLLTPEMSDKVVRRRVMAFLESMETAILEANIEVMGRELPLLGRDDLLRMAVRVAELRADYIQCGVKLSEHRHPPAEAVAELTRRRQAFEELMQVFAAAERVIERGYVKLTS